MIQKDKMFSTVTYPNWFWRVTEKILSETDRKDVIKIIVEQNRDKKNITVDDWNKLFERLKEKFGQGS